MRVVSRLIYEVVKWRARRGLTREVESFEDAKTEANQRGVRGGTFAYWYLRRQGYVFVARNYMPRGAKGEIDLVGYDGDTLTFCRGSDANRAGGPGGAAGTQRDVGEAANSGENGSPISVGTPHKRMPNAL